MNKLKAIGYWCNNDQLDLPHPEVFVGEYNNQEFKSKIIEYLNTGNVYIRWRGLSYCRFNCGIPSQEMGSKCLTDGVWLWPEGLSHYVAKHNVVLPKEFVDHMSHNSWKVQNEYLENIVEDKEYNYSFWLKCSENT